MSVPPEVMQQMMSRGAGGAGGQSASPRPGAPGMPPPGTQTPGASPTPQGSNKQGLKAAAMSNVTIMQNLAEQALTAFEPGDPVYKALLKCLNALEPIAAKNDSSDLVPAEVMRMVGQLPQMGGGTDVQRMIMQQMNKPPQPPQGAPQQPGAMQ